MVIPALCYRSQLCAESCHRSHYQWCVHNVQVSYLVGCIVILTSGSFKKGGSAITSNEGVTILQATVEFANLHPYEYTYSAMAYLVANEQLLQQNKSISGTVTILEQISNMPEDIKVIYQSK